MRRAQVPVDGVVLTEHRQWNGNADYRALEDKFGVMVLKAAEVETDYAMFWSSASPTKWRNDSTSLISAFQRRNSSMK